MARAAEGVPLEALREVLLAQLRRVPVSPREPDPADSPIHAHILPPISIHPQPCSPTSKAKAPWPDVQLSLAPQSARLSHRPTRKTTPRPATSRSGAGHYTQQHAPSMPASPRGHATPRSPRGAAPVPAPAISTGAPSIAPAPSADAGESDVDADGDGGDDAAPPHADEAQLARRRMRRARRAAQVARELGLMRQEQQMCAKWHASQQAQWLRPAVAVAMPGGMPQAVSQGSKGRSP